MAESHPIAFRFVMKAKARGARVIHVDPRFSRTSAMTDMHVGIRPGSDIAFLGGLINHVIQNERYFKEYVLNYTNAPILINNEFKDTDDLDGVFSGWNPEMREYAFESWQYEGEGVPTTVAANSKGATTETFSDNAARMREVPPPEDRTLQDPQCVFQIVKRHFARYTPEMVARTCGVSEELFLEVADTVTRNSGREQTTAWCYSVGWTQHTTAVQIIRSGAILQLLLGNIGRPGGGILALRGHSTIQGSTDIPTLYNLIPGYMAQPDLHKPHETLAEYIDTEHSPTGWWANFPKYIVSLLKAWYGERAHEANDYCFDHVPRIDGDHSQIPMTLEIADGRIQGLFLMGQNPVVGGSNTSFIRKAMASLDWLVVRDAFITESASFWCDSPEVKRGELDPKRIKTEVFVLPASITGEKAGSYTNTNRLVQWHDKAIDPPADARSEPWFLDQLAKRLRDLYSQEPDQNSMRVRQLLDLTWDYPLEGKHAEPDVEAVLQEINGYYVQDGKPVKDFTELKDDGSTACGCWIYSGVMPEQGRNLGRARRPDPVEGPGTHLHWGFAWPANRRILYNRASADLEGKPWSERKKYVWWDAEQREWTGCDVPDFVKDRSPDYQPDWSQKPKGMDAHPGTAPFIMNADGLGWIFAPSGLKDGPLPTHYEPAESPVENPLYGQQINPMTKFWPRPDNELHSIGDPQYPYVLTTHRVVEHHTGGQMTRSLPWLAELEPECWVELDPELAAEKGIKNGDWATVCTARAEVEARALVTSRLAVLKVDGRTVHVIAMPWHFGWHGIAQGDAANDLTSLVGEPNTSIHEGKVLTCNIRAGRCRPEPGEPPETEAQS